MTDPVEVPYSRRKIVDFAEIANKISNETRYSQFLDTMKEVSAFEPEAMIIICYKQEPGNMIIKSEQFVVGNFNEQIFQLLLRDFKRLYTETVSSFFKKAGEQLK
jgi:hypothetical protein